MKGFEVVIQNIDELEKNILNEVEKIAMETSAEMELYAKTNKPWTTITGHARDHLTGKYKKTMFGVIKVQIWQMLYGATGEEYGYYLENAKQFHGKYSILKMTQQHFAKSFFDRTAEALKNVMQGGKND